MTFLFLLLHKGEAESILFMGDNEQTLHFDEFDWTRHFGKLGAFVKKLVDGQPSLGGLQEYRINDPLRLRRWLDKTLMADLGNDTRFGKLTQVERNVPPIVLFLFETRTGLRGQKQTEMTELLTLVHQKLFLESIPMFVLNITWSKTN